MKPVELERQLNVLGGEGWAIVYANDAVVILGQQTDQSPIMDIPRVMLRPVNA